MLRRLGIRAKVLAVLAVPMIVLLAAGAFISYGAIQDLRYARATQTVVNTLDALSPLTAAFQQERILSLTGAASEEIDAARKATDQALASTREVTAKLDLSEFPESVVRDFRDQQDQYRTNLPLLRDRVDQKAQRAVIKNAFQKVVNGQTQAMESVADSLRDRELAGYVAANLELALLTDALVNEYITGIELMWAQAESPALSRSFQSQTTQTESARERAAVAVENLQIDGVRLATADPTAKLLAMRGLFTQGSIAAISTVDPAEWLAQTTNQMTMVGGVNDGVLTGAKDVAADGVSTARDTALATVAAALLALVASFVLAITVSRSIVVPLRRLTSAAADVREQLPRLVEQVATPGEGPEITLAPIPVRSSDEVGRLAQAFNAVNATTVQVAQEQAALRGSIAEMFVNVARRDQVLLNRQLSFIDSLERAEEDPGTLANLFRLDHLATRMRRNAESLLVLAGIDSGRRLRDAMPLSDVIRTASSEIEQYDRVELDLNVDPHMLGFNALSAAHLLAELLENATVFSEPETPVVVATGVSGASVVVRIIDQGLGMSDAEIEAANRKIASVSAGDALGAQRLGLFVVGRLAQRLGAEITLRKRAAGTGTEALVHFPSTLFSANEVNGYGALPPAQAPAGSSTLPEVEAPEARAVDLAELTDGETRLGLPRRRRGEDAEPGARPAAASYDNAPIPVPMLAGPGGLPTRSRKTFDEDNIVLPAAPETTLSPELSVDTGEWTPAVAATPRRAGLPTRARATTSAWASDPQDDRAGAGSAPADPAARVGLFSGFRGRDAVPAAAEQAPTGFAVPSLEPDTSAPAAAESWPTPSWGGRDGGLPTRAPSTPEPVAEPADEAEERSAPWQAPQAHAAWETTDASRYEVDDAAGQDAPSDDAPGSRQAWDAPQTSSPSWDAPQAPAAEWDAPQAPAAEWDAPQTSSPWDAPQTSSPSWDEPQAPAAEWDAPQTSSPSWDAPQWAQPSAGTEPGDRTAEDRDVAPAQPEPSFTSYSGYSGWVGSSDSPALQYTAPYVPFERSLDEARAWHTGAMPVVPDPNRNGVPAWSAPADEHTASDASAHLVEAEPEPEVEEEVASPWAPVSAVTPEPAERTPSTPAWQEQGTSAAWTAEPATAQDTDEWRPTTPTWARSATSDQPTQTFAPIDLAPDEEPAAWQAAPQEPAAWQAPPQEPAAWQAPPQEPAAWQAPRQEPAAWQAPRQEPTPWQAAPQEPTPWQARQASVQAPTPAAPEMPAGRAWQPTEAATTSAPTPAFSDLVASGDDKPKRRWGNFFSRKRDDVEVAEALPAPAPSQAPVRTSAWSAPSAADERPAFPAPQAPDTGWQAPGWSAPPPPAQQAPTPAMSDSRPAPSWSPPEWTGRTATPAPVVPSPALPPSTAPRVGTLDDEVAAMLALRSDIQEQALSELSQLSAYRPSTVGTSGSERLAKRVPSAVPAAPEPTPERPVRRDADELRSRLSSFQTGTSRGRRAAHEVQDGDHQ